MRKSNLEIVIRYLQVFEGERSVVLPDNYKYGLMDNELCLVMRFSEFKADGTWEDGDETWHTTDTSFTYFAKQCTLLDEISIQQLVFQLGVKKNGT